MGAGALAEGPGRPGVGPNPGRRRLPGGRIAGLQHRQGRLCTAYAGGNATCSYVPVEYFGAEK
jgi:hypothetical protein